MNCEQKAVRKSCCTYVLVTPARNEAEFIEATILSVISQKVRPEKWIIVSDGSTDGTDEIVKKYLGQHPWIQLIRIEGHKERNFASKAGCFNAGYKAIGNFPYDVVGNLDADVSFNNGFFEFLMQRFAEDPNLGVAGAAFVDDSVKYNYNYVGLQHVSGLCQIFRRECFEQIGGYQHIKGGGVDLVAVTTARMKGWRTRTYTEISCRHHRKIGTSLSGPLRLRFRYGKEDYYLGSHPLWEILRCARHISERPMIIGALSIYLGYVVSFLNRHPRPVSEDFVSFRRHEQMKRLKNILLRPFVPRTKASGVAPV